jgi:hypothetical protein
VGARAQRGADHCGDGVAAPGLALEPALQLELVFLQRLEPGDVALLPCRRLVALLLQLRVDLVAAAHPLRCGAWCRARQVCVGSLG